MLGLVTAIALAQASAPEPVAAQPDQSEERICRGGGRRQLGSRTRTVPRCRTAEQWRQEEEERARRPIGLQTTEGQNDGRVTATPN
jgi:hypothetical protein